MTDTRVRPLDVWPRERTHRQTRSQFSASWGSTVELLRRELDHLQARNAVILIDVPTTDIRIDGTMPKANAHIGYPGVVIAFDSTHGPLKYISDRFDRWQDNVRAIALGLEALRKVDRYGITSRGEQYTGWAQLPSGSMSTEDAAQLLLDAAGRDPASAGIDPALAVLEVIKKPEVRAKVYRDAVKSTHPDHGGDAAAFKRVREAKQLLDQEVAGGY